MIKAIFIDFDGTLYSHRYERIPDSALDAVIALRKKGYKVFISSGRSLPQLNTFDLRGLEFDGYVLSNGQVLLDENKNILKASFIKGKEKDILVDIYNKKEIPTMFTDLDGVYINMVDECSIKCHQDVGSDMPEIKEYDGKDFVMATLFSDKKEDKELMLSLAEYLNIAWWHKNSIDAINKGVTKLTGIKEILDIYHIDIKDTLALGDNDNDKEMLEFCNIGIAMGNSDESILDKVDYVTTDIDEDGLLNAFKHYNLL